ncbi:MAG: glycosyltransferase family 4 protein [Nitrospirota bacterium]|nr:glycosyltransferase family 4 protein [Nitrospirota bacterium]
MNILMALPHFYPHAGGAEYQALRLGREFVRQGHKVTVITRTIRGLPSRDAIDGVIVFRGIQAVERPGLFTITYIFSLLAFLLRYRRNFDLILTPLLAQDTVSAVLARRITGIPVVARLACGGEYSDLRRLRGMIFGKRILSTALNSDGFIAISDQIHHELLDAGIEKDRIVSIPNGVDTALYVPCNDRRRQRERLGLDPNRRTVVFMGRLELQKGAEYLLKAWPEVQATVPDAMLLMIGEGHRRASLEKMATELGIAKDVRFLGVVSPSNVYLQAADLFVLPSLAEGMSNALLEAMATGLPCVAVRNGSNEGIISDGVNGLLVSPRNEAVLAKALITIMTDSALSGRLGREARTFAASRYNLTAIAKEHLLFYAKLLSGTWAANKEG